MHRYFVYIMASKRNGVLYIGITNNIARRSGDHKEAKLEGFSKKYYVNRLVYFEEFAYVDQAIAREKALKKWNREWKIRLIEEANPEWKDLYERLNHLV